MLPFVTLVSVVLFIFLITSLSNMAMMVRLRQGAPEADQSQLSILIPARNEAAVIGRTVRQLLSQSTQKFELIVLDDAKASSHSNNDQKRSLQCLRPHDFLSHPYGLLHCLFCLD